MAPASRESRAALARRLRQLRAEHWEVHVTQRMLAEAMGVSEGLISSWENLREPVVPPSHRLAEYATFFATRRSIEQTRLFQANELDDNERADRDELLGELTAVRDDALGDGESAPRPMALGGSWHFADGAPVLIVCAKVSPRQLNPEATPAHPTFSYGEMYAFADIDALVELHGHIRAANPRSDVRIAMEAELERDDPAAHLVVLGGVDLNRFDRRLQDEGRPDVPVRQESTGDDPATAYFNTRSGEDVKQHRAAARNGELLADVAQFVRAPNPYNQDRTLSLCRGLYGLGTYGAVRALTDAQFRDRNEEYLGRRFAGHDTFSVLMRVVIVNGRKAITPDWTSATTRLHEWPGGA